MERRERTFLLLVSSFHCFGILFHALDVTFPWMLRFTPVVLAGLGALIIAPSLRGGSRKLLLWVVLVYLATFTLEAVGTATGLVFGPYRYGSVLGPMLLDVPVIIGFNWTIIVMGLSAMVFSRVSAPLPGAFLVAVGCTLFDYVMEPAAIALGYWTWSGGNIPLQNYAAWFIIAFFAALAWRFAGIRDERPFPRWYVLIQLVFFIGLRLFVIRN